MGRQSPAPARPRDPGPRQAHLALVHEASDVGPQGGAASTHGLLPRGRPAAARQAGVEVPQEGLQGGRARRLPHPRPCCPRGWRWGSRTVDGTAAGQQHRAGVCRARGPPPFDPASQEAPPLQACPGSSFCLCGKNTPAAHQLREPRCVTLSLQSPEKPSFLRKWPVSCRAVWRR